MRIIRSALVIACALLPLAPAAAAAAGDVGPNFLTEPAAGSSTEPRGGYFVVAGSPGKVFTQSVALRNDSDSPLDLRLGAVDAATAQLGGSSFALETEKPAQMATWITLDKTSVTLAAKASLTLPFRITVPADAVSGVHLAGISVLVPAAKDSAVDAGGKAGASVTVQSRRVIAVQVNLPGPADPELVITGVAPVARPDGLYLQVAVDNSGRGLTKGEGDVTLADDGFERKFSIDTFVPGTSIAYPIKWTDKATDGDHSAHVEIRYGDRVAVWDGKFTIGKAIKEEQANRQVTPPTNSSSSPAGGLPVGLIAGGIIGAIVLLGGGILLGRRSKDDDTPAPVTQTLAH
ncbi:MAG TPA: DUF916 domain-containing protein [Acidimicrobiales bacterium]|nr:DUF916 domain-containing protein [Acidimicrobiales bacterium]